MPTWDLFISYEWGMKERVHKICKELKERGFQIWIDADEVKHGESIFSNIQNGINNSEIVLAFITLKYCESRSCLQEIRYANGIKNKKILYIALERIDRQKAPNGMGVLLAENYYYSNYCKEWSNDELSKLAETLKAIMYIFLDTTLMKLI